MTELEIKSHVSFLRELYKDYEAFYDMLEKQRLHNPHYDDESQLKILEGQKKSCLQNMERVQAIINHIQRLERIKLPYKKSQRRWGKPT